MTRIVKVPAGERAPIDSDSVCIERRTDGKFGLTASALDGAESIAIIDGGPYDRCEDAEAAGLAWAEGHGVGLLHVELPAA